MNWFLTLVVKAVLEWLTSLLTRLRELEEKKQEGRKEVLDAIKKREEEINREIDKVNKTRTNTSFDDAIRELLDSASDAGSDKVHSSAKSNNGNSAKTK